jgi:hypothetical protein
VLSCCSEYHFGTSANKLGTRRPNGKLLHGEKSRLKNSIEVINKFNRLFSDYLCANYFL